MLVFVILSILCTSSTIQGQSVCRLPNCSRATESLLSDPLTSPSTVSLVCFNERCFIELPNLPSIATCPTCPPEDPSVACIEKYDPVCCGDFHDYKTCTFTNECYSQAAGYMMSQCTRGQCEPKYCLNCCGPPNCCSYCGAPNHCAENPKNLDYPACCREYRVSEGEQICDISERFDVDCDDLKAFNNVETAIAYDTLQIC